MKRESLLKRKYNCTSSKVVEQFVEVIGELYDKYAEQIVGMAISMPGAIDPQKGFAYTGGVI